MDVADAPPVGDTLLPVGGPGQPASQDLLHRMDRTFQREVR
jgi:hypothetical protein